MAFVAPLLPAIGSFLGSAEGIIAGIGTLFTGFTAVQQGNYQAAVAKNNAAVAESNAASESEASQRQAMRSDQEYAAALGEQLAAQGASGFDVLGRTQMATRGRTAETGRETALDIRTQGTNTARRFMQDAANFRSEADAAKKQGWTTAIGAGLDYAQQGSKSESVSDSLVTRKKRKMPWNNKPSWYRKS